MDSDNTDDAQNEMAYYKDTLQCFVPSCKKYRRDFQNSAFLSIPKCLQATWCLALEINCPKRNLYVCQDHINIEEDCCTTKSGKLRLKNTANLMLTNTYDENVPQQYSQPSTLTSQTPPWHNSDSDSNSPNPNQEQQDPLSCRIEQCCFCGEFSKECIAISKHMPYVDSGKTILSLNCMSVQLDFNDTLMNTVCKDCDAKLQELCDFVQQVKTAQEILINQSAQETLVNFDLVKMPQETQINVNDKDTELLVIKTESESEVSDTENESTEIENEESLVRTVRHPLNNVKTNDKISLVEDKTRESLIRTEPSKNYKKKSAKTVPASKFGSSVETASVTHKRKSDKIETAYEKKKLKVVTDRNKGSVEDTIEVKEEPVDEDEINSDVSKLVTENNMSELENAKYIVLKTVEDRTLMVCKKNLGRSIIC